MRMIFVNLPVKSVEASRRFFAALGFSFNERFCDANTACLVIEENIFAMLLEHDRFRGFTHGDLADPANGPEVLLALSAGSREEVDDLLSRALAAGGEAYKPAQDHGFMYGVSFRDPDGHVWEVVWMDPAAAYGDEPLPEVAA